MILNLKNYVSSKYLSLHFILLVQTFKRITIVVSSFIIVITLTNNVVINSKFRCLFGHLQNHLLLQRFRTF